jgi:acyl-CoA thioesterase II
VISDLVIDTTPEQVDEGSFQVTLSRDWEIWGPMGGYVASCALRAVGVFSGRARPASIVGHYLSVANFDVPVDIVCHSLRKTRRADSVRVTMSQAGKPVFEGLVWAVDAGMIGVSHAVAQPRSVPHWSQLKTLQEQMAEAGEPFESYYEFWNRLEQREPTWIPNWHAREPLELPPAWECWIQFRDISVHSDPWIDACRSLILVDLGAWPAADAHHNTDRFMAPSIDIACEFSDSNSSEWLLVECDSPVASDGLIASRSNVFSDDGRLIAVGTSQLLCKELPSK